MSSESHSSSHSASHSSSRPSREDRSTSSARSRRSRRQAPAPAPRPAASSARAPRTTIPSEAHDLPLPDPLFQYRLLIEDFAEVLPHLDKVRQTAREEGASVACTDIADEWINRVVFDEDNLIDEGLDGADGSLSALLEYEPEPEVTVRIISVEDLSQTVIEVLGSKFDLDPEFFEEHLLDSGWSDGKITDGSANVWPTSHFTKDYVSLRWPRPVRMLDQPFTSDEARESMLDRDSDIFEWKQPVQVQQGRNRVIHPVWHQTKILSNILRPAWSLEPLYGKRHKYERSYGHNAGPHKMRGRSPAAWDERISVCKLNWDGYTIFIILFDPLPLVNHWTKGTDEALRRVRFSPPWQLDGLQDAIRLNCQRPWEAIFEKSLEISRSLARSFSIIKTNMLIIEMAGSAYSSSAASDNLAQEPQDRTRFIDGQQIQWRFHWDVDEERNLFQRNEQRRDAKVRLQRRQAKQKSWSQLFGKRAAKHPKSGDEESVLSGSLYDMDKGVTPAKAGPLIQCMFENWSPRRPSAGHGLTMHSNDPAHREKLSQLFLGTSSTASDFNHWIRNASTPVSEPDAPVEILLRIICTDINEYAHLVSLTLTDISQKMLDDILIQQQLFHWQSLLERIEHQCRTTHLSVSQFVGLLLPDLWLEPTSVARRPINKNTPFEDLISQTLSQLDAVREQVRRTGDSLMANMNLLESEKSIAEAESVGKLTELAFVFIPLSFAASVFGMQVKELDPSTTSIAAFFVLAVVSLALLYTARLIVRSESVRAYRYQLFSNIRASAGLVARDPVPLVTFIRYTVVQSMRSIARFVVESGAWIAVAGGGVALMMLIPIWLSTLDEDIKTAITIPLVLISAMAVVGWLIFSASLHFVNLTYNTQPPRTDD